MTWTDVDLMAYADGQIDAARRAALDQALTHDSALRERVASLRAQRARVEAAFAPVLDEPVPDRLLRRLAPPPAVVDIATARAAREPPRATTRWVQGWAKWGGLAASLVLGVLLGTQIQPRGPASVIAVNDGQLVATGAVAQALTTQLASDAPAGAAVAVQLTFLDKAGHVCRTFSTARMAGLACRAADRWAVQQMVAVEPATEGPMRQAATALPRTLLDAVDRQIAGEAFDATRERQAREQGWRR